MKYNNKLLFSMILLSLSILCLTEGILATGPVGENGIDITIANNTIQVQGYTIVAAPPYGVPTKFISSSPLFINTTNEALGATQTCVNFNYTSGNQSILIPTNCTYTVNYFKELPFITNMSAGNITTLTDVTTQAKYDQCVLERAQFSNSYNNCLDRERLLGNSQANLTACTTQLTTVQAQLTPLQSQVVSLQKQIDDSKNTPITWAVIALVIGVGGTYWFTTKNSKIKHPEENYNRNQAQ